MDLEADVIEFRVPNENNKTIFIWDIQPSFSEDYIYESLWSVYSAFGALYLLKVCRNASVAAPGFYALVKFYSAAQASKAQRATDKQCLFQDVPLKVRLSTKQNTTFLSGSKSLSHAKCQDLANHYLGYNGWSTHIITVKDISKCADVGWSMDTGSQGELLKYGSIMELTLPQHGVSRRGVGVAEEVVDREKGLEEKLWKRGKLMKWAKDKAVVAAFEKVLLIVLGNGKVAVECRIDPEEILPDENVEGVVQVNEISWRDFEAAAAEEEDLPWNFTMDLSH
ncbi:RAD52 motif-containing protein 1 [Ictalurus punctatus]|uniref:RAD52 motif-containing protein 1 n=1 Tax=Ictalurus punctatus TaxID=7998 RepID=E3TE03_ICTPU|nr:RAD52 motif-containing protein 1 [Ictalurus punctatus]ADO28539.1 rad52 motif-containing protein 1 [Ictalurus punctatus]